MDAVREEGDRLIVQKQPGRLPRLFWMLTAGMALWLVAGVLRDRRFVHEERFLGLLVGTGTLALFALLTAEQSQFVFDRRLQRLTWRRRWLFRRKHGTVPFSDIEVVTTERPIGDDGVPSRRVVVRTTSGVIPLGVAYVPDIDDACVSLAARIDAFIRQPPAAPGRPG